MSRHQRGATLIETMLVLVTVGLLAGIASPKYREVRDRARAARVIGAMTVIRTAAYSHLEAMGNWPAGAVTGQVPPAMAPYLPTGFEFEGPGYRLAWRRTRWGSESGDGNAQLVQVTTEPQVCSAVRALLGGDGNRELTAACNGPTGMVALYVEN